jgi:pyruvate dehydrogenase E2 component (dihydrolipoamide acetyltransferase)
VREYLMPSLGADMKDGRVVEWFVGPGDSVRRGDVVGVVDTAKGAIEMEIWEDATIEEIVAAPGTKVPVGEVLLRLGRPEGGAEAAPEVEPESPEGMETPPEPASEVPPLRTPMEPRPSVPLVSSAEEPIRPPAPVPGMVRASPAARRRAHELGIDLAEVRGSGPDGAVVLEDVLAAAPSRHGVPTPEGIGQEPETPHPHATPLARRIAETHSLDLSSVKGTGPHGTITRDDVEPLVPEAAHRREPEGRQQTMRDAIAAAMARSKREIPHYYLESIADMRRAEAWLAAENGKRPPETRILPVALLLKAVALSARDYPEVNGHWTEDGYHPASAVHVGLAVALRGGGLIAPALRDTDTRPLDELSAAITDVVQRARSGKLRSSEMTDATLTVSSLGERGVETVIGVIYPPQVALVGFGRVVERPWAEDGLLGVRRTVSITLAGDHRVSDGHRGGLFLRRIAHLLTHPEEL